MKTEKNILIAFLLNLGFSVFECIGGMVTGSVAILSDAVHDLGDAASIGLSYLLEKKSKKQPDQTYTYGYARFSVMGSVITTAVLLLGSLMVMASALHRLMKPQAIHYDGMILLAVVGVAVNLGAVFFTRGGETLNEKAVNLHMLEDVLGWVMVLLGAVTMRWTGFTLLDPLMSMGVAVFILVHAVRHLGTAVDLFLEKTPRGMDVEAIKRHVAEIDGVTDVHHIHLWSMDGHRHCATMHVVTCGDSCRVKEAIRSTLRKDGITHVTLELEAPNEHCRDLCCHVAADAHAAGQHHHHH